MDRKRDALYLTVKKYGWIQTYRMNPLDESGKNFVLELIASGPNKPPSAPTKLEDRFTGIFRAMVDCQIGQTYRESIKESSAW
jgi:hypothetical protein